MVRTVELWPFPGKVLFCSDGLVFINCRLNSVREICTRCPLAISETLLQDLVQYKSHRDKGQCPQNLLSHTPVFTWPRVHIPQCSRNLALVRPRSCITRWALDPELTYPSVHMTPGSHTPVLTWPSAHTQSSHDRVLTWPRGHMARCSHDLSSWCLTVRFRGKCSQKPVLTSPGELVSYTKMANDK